MRRYPLIPLTDIGKGLVKVVRSIKISPASRILAAAGDAKIIALYDVTSGEQIGILNGHTSWIMSLDWSHTGEFLLSGYVYSLDSTTTKLIAGSSYDGKVKVWSIESRNCVATHAETDETVWAVKWLPKTAKGEMFAAAGADRSISFYREAA